MSRRKVAPTLVVNKVEKSQFPNNNSFSSVDNLFLHESYECQNELTVTRCHACKKGGQGSFIAPCDCFGRVYHHECLKKRLAAELQNPKVSVKTDVPLYEINCEDCGAPIKFKASTRQKCKSSSDVRRHCSSHKGLTFALFLNFGALLACIAYILLIALNLVSFCSNCSIAKSTLMIALGVIIFFLSIIAVCCLLDCLREVEYKVQTLYDNSGQSRRSSRSGRSARSGRSKASSRHKLRIESLE